MGLNEFELIVISFNWIQMNLLVCLTNLSELKCLYGILANVELIYTNFDRLFAIFNEILAIFKEF